MQKVPFELRLQLTIFFFFLADHQPNLGHYWDSLTQSVLIALFYQFLAWGSSRALWQGRFPKTGRVFSRLWTENLLIRLQCLDPLDHSPITLYMLVALWWISGKTLLISYSHFSGFLWFVFLFETKKRELAQANESYAGENSYCYYDCYLLYLVPSGNNKPFRITPSTSSGYCRYSVSWWPALTTKLVF